MEKKYTKKPWSQFVVPFLVAYVGSKLIFHFVGFELNVLSNPTNLYKLLVDFGVFIGIFAVTYWAMSKIFSNDKSS
jgi:hypothetical protein